MVARPASPPLSEPPIPLIDLFASRSALYLPLALAVATADALMAGGLLAAWRRGRRGASLRRPISAPVLLAAGLAAALVHVALSSLALLLFDYWFFENAGLLYAALVLAMPAVAALVIIAALRARSQGASSPVATRAALALAWCALAPVPVGLWATFVEPYRLQLEATTLVVPPPAAPDAERPLRIGILADLQTDRVTSYEARAVDRLLAERPDIILLPGDLFQGDPVQRQRELPALRALLGRLDAPGGGCGARCAPGRGRERGRR